MSSNDSLIGIFQPDPDLLISKKKTKMAAFSWFTEQCYLSPVSGRREWRTCSLCLPLSNDLFGHFLCDMTKCFFYAIVILFRNIRNIRICMGKKPIVSVTYENETISIKKQLTLLTMCVTSLLCGPRADLWLFYGFFCQRFSLCRDCQKTPKSRSQTRTDTDAGLCT